MPKQQGRPHQPPYGIAVDPRNGDIYFSDVDSDATVDKYDQDGNFLLEFGGKGDGLGLFQYPSRVAVAPDGKVIVSDSRAEKLSVWDDSGNPLFEKQGQSWGTPTLGRPRGLALDGSGTLFVADALLQQVQVFQFNDTFTHFTYVRSIGRPKDVPLTRASSAWICGASPWTTPGTRSTWSTPTPATWPSSASPPVPSCQYFGGNGTKIDQFSGGGRDVTVDGDGNVWVGDMPNFRAVKFSPNGAFLQQIPDPVVLPPEGGFNQPRGASVDADGNVFVADTHDWRIQKFDAQGDFVTQWGKSPRPRGFAVQLPQGARREPGDGGGRGCGYRWQRGQALRQRRAVPLQHRQVRQDPSKSQACSRWTSPRMAASTSPTPRTAASRSWRRSRPAAAT